MTATSSHATKVKTKFSSRNVSTVFKAPLAKVLEHGGAYYGSSRMFVLKTSSSGSSVRQSIAGGNNHPNAAPAPINTPSLRKEHNGQDIHIHLVPPGGSGWGCDGDEEHSTDSHAALTTEPADTPVDQTTERTAASALETPVSVWDDSSATTAIQNGTSVQQRFAIVRTGRWGDDAVEQDSLRSDLLRARQHARDFPQLPDSGGSGGVDSQATAPPPTASASAPQQQPLVYSQDVRCSDRRLEASHSCIHSNNSSSAPSNSDSSSYVRTAPAAAPSARPIVWRRVDSSNVVANAPSPAAASPARHCVRPTAPIAPPVRILKRDSSNNDKMLFDPKTGRLVRVEASAATSATKKSSERRSPRVVAVAAAAATASDAALQSDAQHTPVAVAGGDSTRSLPCANDTAAQSKQLATVQEEEENDADDENDASIATSLEPTPATASTASTAQAPAHPVAATAAATNEPRAHKIRGRRGRKKLEKEAKDKETETKQTPIAASVAPLTQPTPVGSVVAPAALVPTAPPPSGVVNATANNDARCRSVVRKTKRSKAHDATTTLSHDCVERSAAAAAPTAKQQTLVPPASTTKRRKSDSAIRKANALVDKAPRKASLQSQQLTPIDNEAAAAMDATTQLPVAKGRRSSKSRFVSRDNERNTQAPTTALTIDISSDVKRLEESEEADAAAQGFATVRSRRAQLLEKRRQREADATAVVPASTTTRARRSSMHETTTPRRMSNAPEAVRNTRRASAAVAMTTAPPVAAPVASPVRVAPLAPWAPVMPVQATAAKPQKRSMTRVHERCHEPPTSTAVTIAKPEMLAVATPTPVDLKHRASKPKRAPQAAAVAAAALTRFQTPTPPSSSSISKRQARSRANSAPSSANTSEQNAGAATHESPAAAPPAHRYTQQAAASGAREPRRRASSSAASMTHSSSSSSRHKEPAAAHATAKRAQQQETASFEATKTRKSERSKRQHAKEAAGDTKIETPLLLRSTNEAPAVDTQQQSTETDRPRRRKSATAVAAAAAVDSNTPIVRSAIRHSVVALPGVPPQRKSRLRAASLDSAAAAPAPLKAKTAATTAAKTPVAKTHKRVYVAKTSSTRSATPAGASSSAA